MNKTKLETLVGTAVIGIALSFSYFAYNSSNLKEIEGYTVNARFNSVDGIGSGSEVRIGGIKIGQVVEMDLDPKSYEAVVSLQLREDIKLPEDSTAAIVSASLLGGKYVSVEPGGMEDMLGDGDEISFTQSSVNFESLIGKMVHSGGGVEAQSSDDSE
ncbi:MAG: outer membrane lipid asymmetry maintenance protein MlaD [Rickettsiales bacterium]|nr:outer membrane lipid asymmetry maintenance protein MlaD [Rickettsiales bacterium]